MINNVKEIPIQNEASLFFVRFFDEQAFSSGTAFSEGQAEASIYVRFFDSAPAGKPAKVPSQQRTVTDDIADVSASTQAVVEPTADTELSSPSLLSRLKRGMQKTRSQLTEGLTSLFSRRQFDEGFFDDLEAQLIMADVGVQTTSEIVAKLKEYAKVNGIRDQANAQSQMTAELKSLLVATLATRAEGQKPAGQSSEFEMVLVVGVNGVGKTTTIGKLAQQAQQQGKSVMLAAGDTFRAAAVEQLKVWGERSGVPVVSQGQGSDSASVIYDALQSAQSKKVDLLIADTAGRLHNKSNLMNELQKIVRVVKKINPEAPHKVLLVVDGCTGQNALSQGKEFNAAVPLTGVVVTKLDGTAKGGILFALSKALDVPVEYIGIGEGIDDLRAFEGEAYVEALLDESEETKL